MLTGWFLALFVLLIHNSTATVTTFQNAEPVDSSNVNDGTEQGIDQFRLYAGDGSSCDHWPTKDQWVSFENMWIAAANLLPTACEFYNAGFVENSAAESASLYSAIQEVANSTQIDHRFILAVVMQESRGCVRIYTTVGTHSNPGLMQSYEGSNTCYGVASGQCSDSTIQGMIMDGAAGTIAGDGLASILNTQQGLGYRDAELYYRAARAYNSGSVAQDNILEHGGSTHCYAAMIANRLTGWSANQTSYCCPYDQPALTCAVSSQSTPVGAATAATMLPTFTDGGPQPTTSSCAEANSLLSTFTVPLSSTSFSLAYSRVVNTSLTLTDPLPATSA